MITMKNGWLIITILVIVQTAWSQVPAQWRGTDRSGIYPETGLLTEWPATGPQLLWSVDGIGTGYSSAVSDGKVICLTGMVDEKDVITALNLDGSVRWKVPFGPSWSKSFPDARCTPTIDGDRVYVVSGSGVLACLNVGDGAIIWSFDGVKRFEGLYGEWGVCESLLVTGDMVIYSPAGMKTTLVALNKKTGETLWESGTLNDSSAYVSPRLIHFGGKDIILTVINKYLVGVELQTGKILWTYNYSALAPEKGLKVWPGAPKTNTITPLFDNGNIYITGGYDHVGALFKISDDASAISLVWTDTVLDCHHGGVVKSGNYIYGSNWINNGMGNWCCIDWATGKKLYEQKWFNKGPIIGADGMLYCQDEKSGNIGLVRPTPEKFDLISSFKIPLGKGPYWAHPSIYGGRLYVRHGDVLMAFDIAKK